MSFLRKAALGLGLLALISLSGPAVAAPSVSITTRYYTVSGSTAPELYAAIRRQGPKVAGTDAFATTTPHFSMLARAGMMGGQCRVTAFQLKARFDLLLPRLAPGTRLSPSAQRNWRAFAAHVRAHEMHHVALWTECARLAEAAVRRVRAPSCAETDQRAAALYARLRQACDVRHAAYDAAEGKALLGYGFMKQVLASQPPAASSPGGSGRERAFMQPRRKAWFSFGQ